MRELSSRRRHPFPILALALASVASPASVPAAGDGVDRSEIGRIEDLVEDFANSLHDLSFALLERDLESIAGHFAADLVATGFPRPTGEAEPVDRWIDEEPLGTPPEGLSRDEFLASWTEHLASFESLEDVRLKVKKASVSGDAETRVSASLKFYWLGRDRNRSRKWIRGRAHAEATRLGPGQWRIDRFEVTGLRPWIARTDLFSEVGGPAGTARNIPAWGSPGNEIFLSHGVAARDVDDDGLLDLFVTGTHENFLYRNRGDGTFEDRATEALLGVTPPATAPLFLDYDDDGDSDLFLASLGTQMLFENRLVPDGELVFREVSEEAGVAVPAQGYSSVSADVNGDGRPDIYVCSYNEYGRVMPNSWSDATNGTPNLLFLNRGDGTFEEAAAAWGCADSRWTYAAVFADINGDGRPDLYLANDFGRNALYLNTGERFRDATGELGLTDPGNGMGVSLGDFDNDGDLDLHVTNMSSTAGNRILRLVFPEGEGSPGYAALLKKIASGNTLFRNAGGTFEDVSARFGPLSSGWAFGGGFVDFDNDGWEDLHSPNGFISGKGLKDT